MEYLLLSLFIIVVIVIHMNSLNKIIMKTVTVSEIRNWKS